MEDTYRAIVSSFWEEHKSKRFTQCERDFFFYLLGVWTELKNIHPFPCSSNQTERDLSMPRKTIIQCRKRLCDRGVISFKEGERRSKNPYYYFNMVTKEVTKEVTKKVTKAKEEIPPTPPKEENNIYNNQQQLHAHACEKNLEELKESLMKADIWIESTCLELLRNYKIVMTEDEIKEKLSDYFVHLHSEGIEEKTEQDAKSHFKNWIAKVHEIETKKQKDAERIQRNNSRVSSKPSFNNYDEAEARHVGAVESFEF